MGVLPALAGEPASAVSVPITPAGGWREVLQRGLQFYAAMAGAILAVPTVLLRADSSRNS